MTIPIKLILPTPHITLELPNEGKNSGGKLSNACYLLNFN